MLRDGRAEGGCAVEGGGRDVWRMYLKRLTCRGWNDVLDGGCVGGVDVLEGGCARRHAEWVY